MNTVATVTNDDVIEYTFDWNADKYLASSGQQVVQYTESSCARTEHGNAFNEAMYLIG